MSTSGCGCGCMQQWNPTLAQASFSRLSTMEGHCFESFWARICSMGWERVRSGWCWIVRAVIASSEVKWPAGMHPLYLPPYIPQLNPAEKVFRHLRKHLSNTIFTTLDELQNALIDELQQFWEHPMCCSSSLAISGGLRPSYEHRLLFLKEY